MDLPATDDKNFVRILGLKQQVMSSVMVATVRTRSGDLRDRDDDGVDGFLKRLREEMGEEDEEDLDPAVLVS